MSNILRDSLNWTILDHNWFSALVFSIMCVSGGIILVRRERGSIFAKVMAFCAGVVSAHFFIHMVDCCSIPTLLYLGNPPWKLTYIGGLWNIAQNIWVYQWYGAEIIAVWGIRNRINLKSIRYIIPVMIVFAFLTNFIHGTMAMRTILDPDKKFFYYIVSYIPMWIMFCGVYLKFFMRQNILKKEADGK